MPNNPQPTSPNWLNGVKLALPIVVGYIPIGIAFGVLARKVGISAGNTMLMSLLVFAGSSQLIAVGLFMSGVSAVSIVVTTFIVNLRHLLMTAALSPYLKRWSKLEMAAFAYEVTDETFAVHSTHFYERIPPKAESFAINVTAQVSWLLGTWIGIVSSALITDVERLALDYALPAMFIGLLVMQIKDRIKIAVALLAGVLSVVFLQAGADQWNVILATIIGATSGIVIEKWIKN